MKKLHALVLGATGATGRELVNQLLKNDSFSHVSIFVRNSPNISHEKLSINTINFSKISEYKSQIKGDVLFSALGTTKKDAGSSEQQFLVDYTYQYKFAEMAYENGVTTYSLVSSNGANKDSFFFYPKIKGALEEKVKSLDFNNIQIFDSQGGLTNPSKDIPLILDMHTNEKVNLKQLISKKIKLEDINAGFEILENQALVGSRILIEN